MFQTFPQMTNTKTKFTLLFLCLFQAFLSFKPSEPYLSEYLICNRVTKEEECLEASSQNCESIKQCSWDDSYCYLTPCDSLSSDQCEFSGDIDIYDSSDDSETYNYCEQGSDNKCQEKSCQTNLSENDVNNDVYPWSTFAYLPFLLGLGDHPDL